MAYIKGKKILFSSEVKITSRDATLIEKEITENGLYNASDDNADGYSSVSVSVDSIVTPSGIISITENGTYNVTNYASAEVEIPSQEPNLITKEITANGSYSANDEGVDGYSNITVNVASSGGGSGSQKLSQLVNRTITSVSEEDLDGITSIGDYAFYNCTSLTDIVIPSGVTIIRQYAFHGCSGLKNITIPEGVTIIANYVFYNCNNISEITIPASVTTIATRTFAGSFCGNIRILATTPPTLTSSESISSNVSTIYIPAGTLSAYQSATNWSNFSSKFVEA